MRSELSQASLSNFEGVCLIEKYYIMTGKMTPGEKSKIMPHRAASGGGEIIRILVVSISRTSIIEFRQSGLACDGGKFTMPWPTSFLGSCESLFICLSEP